MESFVHELRSTLGLRTIAGVSCRSVRRHLSAFQDGEVAPGLQAQLEEHLERCPACTWQLERLERAIPLPPRLLVPPAVRDQLHEELERTIEAELAQQSRRSAAIPSPPPSWLTTPLQVPRIAIVAYAGLLLAALGWGASGWFLDVGAAEATVAAVHPATAPTAYRPASFVPSEDWF